MPDKRSSRLVGGISLACMAAGFAVVRSLEALGIFGGVGHQLLRSGFEAGMVGGLADWYAVTVLFRRAPFPLRLIPIFDTHSRLLVKNRTRITDNIVTLVQEEWLTPAAIKAQLEGKSLVEAICSRLEDAATRETLVTSLADTVSRQLDMLDAPDVLTFLTRLLRDQLATADLARPIGQWIERTAGTEQQDAIWQSLAGTLERLMDDPSVRDLLERTLMRAAEQYASESWANAMMLWLAEGTGAFDKTRAIAQMLDQAKRQLEHARHNPSSALRQRANAYVLNLSRELQTDGSPAARSFERMRERLASDTDLGPFLRHVLSQLKTTLRDELHQPTGELHALLSTMVGKAITHLRDNPEQRDRIDAMLRDAVVDFVARNRSLIGGAVRASLSPEKLPDEQLVNQIEPKVWDDLQFIRLNGAVVGFMVGVAIAATNLLIARLTGR